jgi:HK97 family phage portal protein
MFLTKIKADSGDRSAWGGFWFNPVPFNGANVTADSSLQLTAVYACVRYLSNTMAKLPFVLYEESANGTKTKVKNHWLYRLFARRPNDFQNPSEFRAMMQGHLSLRGNAFARIFANGLGEVTDLIPIHPDRVTVELLTDTNWRYQVRNQDGTTTPISRRDMFHLKGLSGDGIMGYSPIQLARNALSGAIAAQNYGTRFFENDAAPTGGWIEHPGNFKTDEARRLWRESWQEMQGGRNKGKTAVLEYGLKYHDGVAVSNGDAQFIESRKHSVSEIARMFGVRPHKIGDLEKATFSNIEQQSQDSVDDDIDPWVDCWEEAIRFNFLDPEDDTLEVEFPLMSLLRGDSQARSMYYHNGILDGWLTRNEARIAESYNPLPGLDEPLRPLNMIKDSDASEAQDPPFAGKQPTDARLVALASAAAERVARKEAEMVAKAAKSGPDALIDAYARHAPFVAGALGIGSPAAQTYCMAQLEFTQANGGMDIDAFAEIARCKLERLALQG